MLSQNVPHESNFYNSISGLEETFLVAQTETWCEWFGKIFILKCSFTFLKQPTSTCLNSTIEPLVKDVKYFQR